MHFVEVIIFKGGKRFSHLFTPSAWSSCSSHIREGCEADDITGVPSITAHLFHADATVPFFHPRVASCAVQRAGRRHIGYSPGNRFRYPVRTRTAA